MPLTPSFYVTTLDENNHEHNYRFPQGENLPENHRFKSQRPAGLIKLRDLVSEEKLAALGIK
jgi:hypothetical protein